MTAADLIAPRECRHCHWWQASESALCWRCNGELLPNPARSASLGAPDSGPAASPAAAGPRISSGAP